MVAILYGIHQSNSETHIKVYPTTSPYLPSGYVLYRTRARFPIVLLKAGRMLQHQPVVKTDSKSPKTAQIGFWVYMSFHLSIYKDKYMQRVTHVQRHSYS